MKNYIRSFVALLVCLSLFLGLGITAFAENSREEMDKLTATGMLAPVNPNASQQAKNLLAYLSSLSDSDQFVVGQFDMYNRDLCWNNIKEQHGVEPGLYSSRYILETDANGTWFNNVDTANGKFVEHYNDGAILLVHADQFEVQFYIRDVAIAAGWYVNDNDMIVELDETNPDRHMELYNIWIEYLNNYFAALHKLEDAGVKAYLLRLFVESNYKPFCGITTPGFESFKRVYRQTVEKFQKSGLEGFLLTYSPGYSSGTMGVGTLQAYPGNDCLDVLGVTLYVANGLDGVPPGDKYTDYDWFVHTGKPLGCTELSCRAGGGQVPRSSWLNTLQALIDRWPRTTYVNCWGDGNFSLQDYDPEEGLAAGQDDGKLFLESPFSLTLEDLPDYQNGKYTNPGIVQIFGNKNFRGAYVGMEERLYTEAELKELGVSLNTVGSVYINNNFGVQFYSGDNGTGDMWGYPLSLTDATGMTDGKAFKSLRIIRQKNVALDQLEIYASDNDGDAWKANDGNTSRWTGKGKNGWLYIDFGSPNTISRYVVRHGQAAGMVGWYNTADFRLQYSVDGENWVTVDTVKDNEGAVTDRKISPVTAQYYRLYIDKPNSATSGDAVTEMNIMEFELYGMDVGKAFHEESTTTTTKKPTTTTTKKVTTTTKKTTTTTALKLATPKVTVSNATKGIKVSWGKVSKADKYYVYRKTGSGSWSKIKTVTGTSYTDESAKAGKSYQYMVKAVKGSVTSSYKAVSIIRLAVPTVKAANAGKGIKVSWGKVSKATSYRVYRRLYSSGKWGSWSKIKTTTSTSYTDTGAKTGKNYQYMVKAVKGDSTSYYKATATIRRLKAPSSLKLTKATKGFKVSWSKATGATKYEVYRKTGNGSYTKIATTSKTAYTDKNAKKGKYYTYRVRAVYSSSKSVFKTGSKTKR